LLAWADAHPGAFLFLRKDGGGLDDRDAQQHIFRPAAERAGIYRPGFGLHSLRRLNVSWRQSIGGASPLEAQKAAGHASLNMTMLYTQPEQDREREQVGRILEHLGRPATGEKLAAMAAEGGIQ